MLPNRHLLSAAGAFALCAVVTGGGCRQLTGLSDIEASGGGGGGGGPTAADPLLLVSVANADDVYAFRRLDNGSLEVRGIATRQGTGALAVDAGRARLFVAQPDGRALLSYAIGPVPNTNTPLLLEDVVPIGVEPAEIVVAADLLLVASPTGDERMPPADGCAQGASVAAAGQLLSFTLNEAGIASATPASTLALPFVPGTVVVSPDETWVAVSDLDRGRVFRVEMDGGGALTPAGSYDALPAGATTFGLRALDFGSNALYFAHGTTSIIATLTESWCAAGLPEVANVSSVGQGLRNSGSGDFFYSLDPATTSLAGFALASNGSLSPVGTATTVPTAGAFDRSPDDRFLYVLGTDAIATHRIDELGAPSPSDASVSLDVDASVGGWLVTFD